VAIVDRNGRVFGLLNVIDAFVLLVAIALVPASIAAWRAFRERPVVLGSVTPTRLFVGSPVHVQLSGTQFRPYLQAFVARAGEPFSIEDVDRGKYMGTYLLSSPSLAELHFPDLAPGRYDLYLTEHGRVIVSRAAAFSVSQPDYPVGVRTLKVQFYPPLEAVSLIHVGDKDILEPTRPSSLIGDPAVVTAVLVRPDKREVVDMRMAPKQDRWIGLPTMGRLVEVTLRLPVLEIQPDGWAYGEESIRAGGLFTLTTESYRFHGVITWVSEVERVERPRPGT
jgi:hypothetical protein